MLKTSIQEFTTFPSIIPLYSSRVKLILYENDLEKYFSNCSPWTTDDPEDIVAENMLHNTTPHINKHFAAFKERSKAEIPKLVWFVVPLSYSGRTKLALSLLSRRLIVSILSRHLVMSILLRCLTCQSYHGVLLCHKCHRRLLSWQSHHDIRFTYLTFLKYRVAIHS